uniref:Uncharacterized protein n=1 Tax=Mustela putorius furo TaxID=9669 RepID=M3XX12_MUSPF
QTCGLREPSSVKHLDDWESCAPPGLRRLPGGSPGKIPALRTRARAAVGHAARVRGSAIRTPGEKPSRLKAREHSSQHQRAQVPHHSSAAQEEKGKSLPFPMASDVENDRRNILYKADHN